MEFASASNGWIRPKLGLSLMPDRRFSLATQPRRLMRPAFLAQMSISAPCGLGQPAPPCAVDEPAEHTGFDLDAYIGAGKLGFGEGKSIRLTALFDDETGIVQRHAALHIGIATQTPQGLMVPVVRHAEALDLWEVASEISRLAAATRDGTAARDELSGSTLTITSLGPIGGIVTTPVINHPEVAIIGVNRIVERPVARGGQIVIRKMMNLSSSFDHRVVDGWEAAQFVQELKGLLEQPASLFVE